MKILSYTRKAFSLLGYLPHERIFCSKFVHAIVSFLFILNMAVGELAGIIYMIRHLKIDDIRNSLYASFQIIGLVPAIASFISMMMNKDNIRVVIIGLQKITKQCNGC